MRDRSNNNSSNSKRLAAGPGAPPLAASTKSHHLKTTSSSSTTADPTALLARGYLSRYLLTKPPLTVLSAEEIDKDLLHFGAYRSAALSYRQQYYMAVNNTTANGGGSNMGMVADTAGLYATTASPHGATAVLSPSHSHQYTTAAAATNSFVDHLPIRIDPEEEKRLVALRRKILKAECLREELEQTYVALRAHFVHVSHELQAATQSRAQCIGVLQDVLVKRSRAIGYLRARLQMARDVCELLQYRQQVLQQDASASGATMDANATVNSVIAANLASGDNALLAAWNDVEEGLKEATSNKASSSKNSTTTSSSNKKPMPWPCTKEPSTPHGVPLLLSSLAHLESAPEKSIAFGTNQAFGAKKHSLVWLPHHLPAVSEDGNDDDDVEGDVVMELNGAAVHVQQQQQVGETAEHAKRTKLQQEAAFLQSELDKEYVENEQLWHKITKARSKNDEWVAMICLLRQETEAVLFRHNIVMDSDEALDAAERRYLASEQARLAATAASDEGGGGAMTAENGKTSSSAANGEHNGSTAADKPELGKEADDDDDDNDGDDEGSNNNDEDDEGEWEGKKRAAADNEEENGGGGGGASRKKARRNE